MTNKTKRSFDVGGCSPVRSRRSRRGAIVLAVLLVSRAAAPQEQPPAQGSYRIGAGDLLDIIVWRNQELSRAATVRPDGWISFPLLDDVQAAGLTPTELQKTLTGRLQKFVSSPIVTVVVSRVGSFKVSILGRVQQAGRYDLQGPTTVLDMLALAGGADDYADTDNMVLLRPVGGTYQRIPFKYSAAIRAGGEGLNISVSPGDIIIVP